MCSGGATTACVRQVTGQVTGYNRILHHLRRYFLLGVGVAGIICGFCENRKETSVPLGDNTSRSL
jgi:hypothetical protein